VSLQSVSCLRLIDEEGGRENGELVNFFFSGTTWLRAEHRHGLIAVCLLFITEFGLEWLHLLPTPPGGVLIFYWINYEREPMSGGVGWRGVRTRSLTKTPAMILL
jgi:hypothetical protein